MFVDWGFAGNRADYTDPRNSLLGHVLDRRLGIPITLAIVLIEVGRRIGVRLHGVGMPGHFLVGIDAEPGVFLDPFAGGVRLDEDGCRERFVQLNGPDARFTSELLAPTPKRAIVLRVLNNLEAAYSQQRSRAVVWVVRLRLAFTELPAGEVRRAAAVLGSCGAYAEGAVVLERLARQADAAGAAETETIEAEARALRARMN
jgi:regulator of sirC expression with transglutaminase-like and TPR domain